MNHVERFVWLLVVTTLSFPGRTLWMNLCTAVMTYLSVIAICVVIAALIMGLILGTIILYGKWKGEF